MKIKKRNLDNDFMHRFLFLLKDIRTTKEKKNVAPNLLYSPLTVTYRVELLFAQMFMLQADMHTYFS
jgi:hypothetical protein